MQEVRNLMACTTTLKNNTIKEAAKPRMKALKKSNPDMSNAEIRKAATAQATSMVEQAMMEQYEEEVDDEATLPAGVASELNANKPKAYSSRSKNWVPITVTEVTKDSISYTYPRGTKSYTTLHKDIRLDQGDTEATISKYTTTMPVSDAIANNTSFTPVPEVMPDVVVSEDVRMLNDKYLADQTDANYEALVNAEIAAGYRNTNGERIVNFKNLTLGSSSDNTTHDEFDEIFIDTDGSINKASAINEQLIEYDKKNNGENFNKEHSDRLTALLGNFQSLVNDINDKEFNFSKKDFISVFTTNEASGEYDTATGDIDIELDMRGPGQGFRNDFTMTNQEVLLHELTHAMMYFIENPGASVSANSELHGMIGDLRKLYLQAGKDTTWKTLLPGIENGAQYTDAQIAQAKRKWDYIFGKDSGTVGLHEFVASMMTNEMFRDGMEQVATGKGAEHEAQTIVEKVQEFFRNILSRVLGMVTDKKTSNITVEGTRLITDIMRANSKAADVVANKHKIASAKDFIDSIGETIEVSNDTVRKVTEPFLGAFSALDDVISEKGGKVLTPAQLTEFIKLSDKLNKLSTKIKNTPDSGNKLKDFAINVFELTQNIITVLRALPAIYKMRGLTANLDTRLNLAKQYTNLVEKLLSSMHLSREGFVRGMARDFLSRPGLYNALADSILVLTHDVDHARETVYEHMLEQSTDWFGDVKINKDILNIRNNEALTDVVLRTDIQSIVNDTNGLKELLMDPEVVLQKIKKLSSGLSATEIADAESMANYMVTGMGVITSAHNIAAGFGTGNVTKPTEAKIKQIDELISYMAFRDTNTDSKEQLLSFINGDQHADYASTLTSKIRDSIGLGKKTMTKEEYVENVENGIDNFIAFSRGLQVKSREEVGDDKYLAIKGYMKETFNSDYEIEFHPMRDAQQLIDAGYKFVREVAKAPGMTTQYGMFISNSPAVKRVNGALGLQDKKSRGFKLSDMINQESDNSATNWDRNKRSEEFQAVLNKVKDMYAKDRTSVDMSPVYDAKGNIVDFRVTMSIADKKEFMGLEGRGTQNLARSQSTMGNANKTALHNIDVIDMLHSDYLKNYKGNEEQYAVIEPRGLDASDYGLEDTKTYNTEYERLWARLPKSTKAYARKKFGSNKIVIKKEMLRVAFGEDNMSIANSKYLDKFPAKVRTMLAKAEAIWIDMMQIAKKNIVIKIPEVLTGNIWSNFKILLYLGVHPIKGAKMILTAAKELRRYEADTKELGILLRSKDAGLEVNENRIQALTDSIKSNTVTPLIDKGLYQSIMEDVNTAHERNAVAKWFSDKTDKYITNETVNGAIQLLFMTERTKPYQLMLKATQVSDFYFRYAQYYDAIDKANAKLDKATTIEKALEAINKYVMPEDLSSLNLTGATLRDLKQRPAIREAFKNKAMRESIDNYINYEAPLHKFIRYGDSVGTWFFVKYFTRIQKVVMKIARENPLRVGADILLQFMTKDAPDILDAFVLDKGLSTYNPFKLLERFFEFLIPAGPEVVLAYAR